MRILLLNILLLCLSFTICAQTNPYKEIKKGNKQYLKTEYNNAINEYEEALKKDESSFIANYNIANALYKNADVSKDSTWSEKAINHYKKAIDNTNNSNEKSMAYHNLGNVYLKNEDYKNSINAYKESLRLNPEDNETRYNLAYAKGKLKQQENQQNQNENNNEENNKDNNENQDQNQDQKDQKDQNKNEDKEKEERENSGMAQKTAEQILDILEENEKKTLEKMKMEERKATKRYNVDKDW